MAGRNIHAKPFDEGTVEKLQLYREYLRAWLPTFIHLPKIARIQIFDFFAGPGHDPDGKPGSPIVAFEEVRLALDGKQTDLPPKIDLYFNEIDQGKSDALCRIIASGKYDLPNVNMTVACQGFEDAFNDCSPRMSKSGVANLVFLDQNGVKFVTREVFQRLAQLSRTDSLFFISSATVNRFKELPEIRSCVPVSDADLERMNGTNVHRILADAYSCWLPDPRSYFIAPFSIRKGANVYGLVFGSGHPFGMDKFLRVAWNHGGDANFDIDGDGIDHSAPNLFPDFDKPTKIKQFEQDLAQAVLARKLLDNKAVYEFSLRHGMLGRHAKDALVHMMEEDKLPKQTFQISYDAWKKMPVPIIF